MKNNLLLKTRTLVLSALFVLAFSLNSKSQCAATFTMGSSGPLTWTVMPTYAPNTASTSTWVWGDGNWSIGMYPSHTYTAAGVYTICVVTNNTAFTCTSTTCDSSYISKINMTNSAPITIQVISGATSIKEQNAAENISIFPNPTIGKVQISDIKENGILTVYNVLGVKVQELKIEKNATKEVDLSAFDNGIYSIEFSTGKAVSRQKVILSK